MRILIALQLALLLGVGAATVVRFPVFALVDERAHFAYVQEVAEHGRLPFLGRDLISPEAQAIDEGSYPDPPTTDPRTRGLAGYSYEAFQPPLYYAAASPVYRLAGSDHLRKLRLLRVLGLVALMVAAALLWKLASEVAGRERATGVYAVALGFLLWPGVVVRTVTVSNAALELVLGVAAALALWRAGVRRDPRALYTAGLLVGLGLLTRLSFAAFGPWLLWVARLYPRRTALVAAVLLPAALIAPWVASKVDRYGAPTAAAVVREMEEPTLNPTHERYGVGDLPDRARSLLNGILPEEWWSEFLSTAKRRVRDLVMAVVFAMPLALALRRRPRRGSRLLVVPLAAGLALMVAGLIAGNWDFFYPRYAYAGLLPFGVFAGAVLRHPGRAAAVATAALTALWAYLATVTPFSP